MWKWIMNFALKKMARKEKMVRVNEDEGTSTTTTVTWVGGVPTSIEKV